MSPVLRSHASHGSNLACGLMPGQPLATARRSQRFSDSPCRCRLRFEPERRPGGKCLACLGLHQRLVVLEAAKEELSNLAALQREELQYLNNRYELSSLAQEFDELQQEKSQLEGQLKSYRSAPARLRSLRQAEAQQAAAREAWLAEKESLQAEVAAVSKEVASSRDKLELQRRHQELRQELAQQRQQCQVAEDALRAQSHSASSASSAPRPLPRQPPARPPEALAKMRSEIKTLAEARQHCSADLRTAKEELEALRRELAAISADNAQLRSGLHSVMVALDEVQRQL